MQQFSLVYNNLFVFLEPVDEPRPTYACGQLMQGSSSGNWGGGVQKKCLYYLHTYLFYTVDSHYKIFKVNVHVLSFGNNN